MTSAVIYNAIDPFLIWIFRIPGNSWVGFGFGLVWVCLVASFLGELLMALVYLANKKHYGDFSKEMVNNHNLSVQAIRQKNKVAWKACNDLANDAFGKNFFSHIALFASSLWPVPFIIGWMSWRFASVDFMVPWIGEVGPSFYLVPTYIVVRYAFAKMKPYMPFFKNMKKIIEENEGGGKMLSYADLVEGSDKSVAAENSR